MLPSLLVLAAGAAHADDYADVNALLRQGKADEALAKADAYIAGKPRDPQMRFLRGVILTEQGKQADATAVFTQLTQDFPELPEPYNNLAALYAAQSQFDKARAALEMAIKLNPTTPPRTRTSATSTRGSRRQSYGRAQQLEAGNTTVPPKLALIRQLFSDAGRPARCLPRRRRSRASPFANEGPRRRAARGTAQRTSFESESSREHHALSRRTALVLAATLAIATTSQLGAERARASSSPPRPATSWSSSRPTRRRRRSTTSCSTSRTSTTTARCSTA